MPHAGRPHTRSTEDQGAAPARRRQTWPRPAVAAGLLLLVAALLSRGWVLSQYLAEHPLARTVRGDAGVYWEMAGRVAAGHFVQDGPFLSVPLYPYALAVIRAAGGGLTTVFIAQMLLHLVTAALLGLLATRRMGAAVGFAAAAVFLLLEEPLFYATRVLPSTLQLFLIASLLLAADRFRAGPGHPAALLTAALLGLVCLVYPPALAMIPLLALWVWWRCRSTPVDEHGEATATGTPPASPGGRPRCSPPAVMCGLLAAGVCLLVVSPATLHNWRACGEFIPITAHAGITFRQGNAAGADGRYTPIAGVRAIRELMHEDTARVYTAETGRAGSYRQIDRFFLRRGVAYLAADPLRAAGLVVRKAYWFLSGRHYADLYLMTLEWKDGLFGSVRVAPVPTAWLMGPALAGLLLWRRAGRPTAIDLAALLLPLLIVAAFWYSPRYRLPVVPPLVLASVAALAAAGQAGWSRKPDLARVAVTAALLALSVAAGPINAARGFDDAEQYRADHECVLGQAYARLGAYEEAIACFQRAHQIRPGEPASLIGLATSYEQAGLLDQASQAWQAAAAAEPHNIEARLARGMLELNRGQPAAAQGIFERCLQLDPHHAAAHVGIWVARSRQGDNSEDAVEHLEEALRLDPGNALAHSEYGILLVQRGEQGQAEHHFRRATELEPGKAEGHYNLGVLLMDTGRPAEAAACFQQALELDPTYEKARVQLAALAGRPAQRPTEAQLRRAIEAEPGNDRLYSELAGMLHARGDLAGAVDVLRQGVSRAADPAVISIELAWLLATTREDALRDGAEAVRLVEAVLDRLADPPPAFLDVYAAALAEAGRYDDAAEQATRAAQAASQAGEQRLAETIAQRAAAYRARRPHRQ